MNFDYTLEPGKTLEKREFEKDYEPEISIIIPYYNDKKFIKQTLYSILNQTFSAYEILIIDDGSKDQESLEVLDSVSKLDKRIKVFHKENEGLAATRDFGASKASKSSKYFFFIDSDDLIEKTYLECAYWTLETNKKASWAYTDSVGFEGTEYTWNKWFNSNKMKKINDLCACALIRKEAFFDVKGYALREKAVNEDWNFWLKLIAKGRFPVRMNFYGFWYRRKKQGSELAKSRENKSRSLEIIHNTAKTIKKNVKAIQYPFYKFDYEIPKDNVVSQIKYKRDNKKNVLIIIPWMVVGGADKFNLDFIEGLDKNKYNVVVLCTEPAVNVYRQEYEKIGATIYDLTTFISQKYWLAFTKYIIEKNNIDLVINTNSEIGYSFLPYIKANFPEVPIIDYIHMEEWYNRNGGYSRDSSTVSSVIDKTFTCNENSRKILVDYFGRKPEETKTIYIGVDENKFNPEKYSKEEARKEFGVTHKYVIGFICRIAEQKRPFLLLEIIKKLKNERNDFEFLIAGEGNLLPELKSKVKRAGLSDNVKFIGNIQETQKFYITCDVTLNCSIKEGVALTSYESLSMNVPVVSSNVGGQAELINEDVGEVIPCMQDEKDILDHNYSDEEINAYVNAINKILNNISKYKENCRKRILNGFTIDQMKQNMNKIVEDEIANPNKEKIENGKALSKMTDICKEFVTEKVLTIKEEYEWECKEYNSFYNYKTKTKSSTKKQIFADRMWKHAWYRQFIKFVHLFYKKNNSNDVDD